MTTVAFVGLGIMGGPMAGHLVDAGFDVIGVNPRRRRRSQSWSSAAAAAPTIAEAARERTSSR